MGLPLLPWLISEYIFSGLKNSPPSSGFPSLSFWLQNLWPNATASSCDWTSGFPREAGPLRALPAATDSCLASRSMTWEKVEAWPRAPGPSLSQTEVAVVQSRSSVSGTGSAQIPAQKGNWTTSTKR